MLSKSSKHGARKVLYETRSHWQVTKSERADKPELSLRLVLSTSGQSEWLFIVDRLSLLHRVAGLDQTVSL